MNGYIVDPAVFYWINVFSNLQIVFGVIGGLSLVAGLIALGVHIYFAHEIDGDEGTEDVSSWVTGCRRNAKLSKKIMIPTLIIAFVFILAAIFIPEKNTSIEMLIARTMTYENTEWTLERLKEAVDYIVAAMH